MAVNINEARLRLTAEDATGRGMASAARNIRATAREAEQAAQRLAQVQQRISNAGTALAGGLGIGVSIAGAAAAAKQGYVEFARFDRQMTSIGITADASKEEMAKAAEQLKVMAKTYALPIESMAEGLDALVSSGKTLPQAMAYLPTVAATAQASGAAIGDIARASDALTGSMGFTAENMQHAMDILAKGGKAGKFELKDMAQRFPELAEAAAAVGYKGEEGLKTLVAILQVVRKQTGDAGQAADATRDMFAKMGSDEVANGIEKIGGDRGVLRQMQQTGGDVFGNYVAYIRKLVMSYAELNGIKNPMSVLPQIFGDIAMQNGMRALLTQPGAVRDLRKELGQVDNTVMNDLARKQDDAAAAAQRLSNAMLSVQQAAGKMLDSMHVTGGLEWLAETLSQAARGAENITKLGFFGSAQRGMNIRAFEDQKVEYEGKKVELSNAKKPEDAERIRGELRELEQRMEIQKRRIYDTGTDEDRKSLFPNGPPTPIQGLDPKLRAPTAREEDLRREAEAAANRREELRRAPNAPRDDAASKAEVQAEFERQRANNRLNVERYQNKGAPGVDGVLMDNPRGAQEDTQKGIKDGIERQNGLLRSLVGPASYGGTSGGRAMFQRASYSEATNDFTPPGGAAGAAGAGGGGRAEVANWGAAGGAGGTAGNRNLRYGGGGGGSTPRKTFGGGGTPADDGNAPDLPGTMNPRLAGSRKALMDELDNNPQLRRDVIKTASMENRGSPAKMQAVIESMVNRSKMNGYRSLNQAIHSGFYGPVNRGGLSGGLSDKDRRDGEEALKRVQSGSNIIGYRTDQGMLTDPGARRYMQEPDHSGHQNINGENFFYMGAKGRAWAKQQEALDAQKAKEAGPQAVATPPASKATPPASGGSDMADVQGPIHPDDITKLSPYAGQKDRPKRLVQDPETQRWRPDFKSDGSDIGGGIGPNAGGGAGDGDHIQRGQRARADLQTSLDKPIIVDVQPRIAGAERLRDRTKAQSRREVDREVRDGRLNTYSDVGCG